MKIRTSSVSGLHNLITKAYSTTDSVNSLVLIDFENSKAYMKSINGIHLSLEILVEDYDSDICDKLITNANKFLSICTMCEELEVVKEEGKIIFKYGDNNFQLSSFEDTKIIPTTLFEKAMEISSTIKIEETLIKDLKKTASYLSKDDNSSSVYRHVFIEDDTIFSLSEDFNILLIKDLVDEETTGEGADEDEKKLKYPNSIIYRDVIDYIQIIHSLGLGMELSFTDKNYILKSESSIVIFPLISDVKAPNIISGGFADFASHDSSIVVDKLAILDFLASVKPFTNEIVNCSLYFSIKENNLVLSTTGNDKININFEVKEVHNFDEDFTFIFEGNQFSKNLKNLEGNTITIEVGNTIKQNLKGKECEVFFCKMYSEIGKETLLFQRLSES